MKGFYAMLVNILVSTIDAGINQVDQILLDPRSDIKYIISHQVTDDRFRPVPEALKRADILVGQIEGRGLSRNRNNAFKLADGDIGILADDDVRYCDAFIDNVLAAYAADRELGAACFKIATPEGQPLYKEYTAFSYLLNEESHHYLSSLEITVRLKALKEKKLRFDERFGLGSKLNSFGEEAVFIHDCIKAGLKVKYLPEYIVEHEATSTIKAIDRYATSNNTFKGAYDARRYGWLAFPAAFYGTLRFWADIAREGKNPVQYLNERLKGALYIYREPRFK
jgi:glycosyltransferase involved in cell wall biosynthesis